MKTPFVVRASFSLWLARRRSEQGEFGERFPYPVANSLRGFRHDMRQNHRDFKRRGLSNREGAGNRRWRRFLATRERVLFSTPAFDLVA